MANIPNPGPTEPRPLRRRTTPILQVLAAACATPLARWLIGLTTLGLVAVIIFVSMVAPSSGDAIGFAGGTRPAGTDRAAGTQSAGASRVPGESGLPTGGPTGAGGSGGSASPSNTATPDGSAHPASSSSPRPATASAKASVPGSGTTQGAASSTAPSRPPATTRPAAAPGGTTAYMFYYLWWTPRHWQEKLGSSYPYGAKPAPAPGSMDAGGCNPSVRYSGATIIDVPAEGLYDQGNGATFDRHIAQAVGAHITGFVVSWQGTGQAGQSASSSGYNSRLDLLVARVNAYNAAHGTSFRLILGLEAFGNYGRPASQVINDLDYFRARYAGNRAFANQYSGKPVVMLIGSRKYAAATVKAVSGAERAHLFLIGDETYSSWPRDAAWLDGSGYYWSSQDPWNNPQSGAQVASLSKQVHAAGKAFFAPFNGGFNTQLNGGSACVPRLGVRTLDEVWRLNRPSNPEGWFGISWNEFVENSYLEPSALYGSTYLNEIKRLVDS